ncbi:MAG: D-2-hydroxyacid dehydrogenase family protein [Dehalococcoidia bacterium]
MKVVVLEDWNSLFVGAPALDRLRGRLDIEVQTDRPADRAALIERLRDAEIVVLNRERTRLDRETIAQLPRLNLIVQTGGVSGNVDVTAASEQGIEVCGAPGLPYSIDGVAELALGMLLTLARQMPANDRAVRGGAWNVAPTVMLHGLTMGILGLGRLGRSLARLGQALQMPVIANGPTLTPERAAANGVGFVSLDELCERSDALFVCPRLSEMTRGMVTRAHLALLKPTAYLINVARGPIVDEAGLLEALQERRIAGAGLDVFGEEPLPADHPLTTLDNVVLAPHIGWVTETNAVRFVESVVERIEQHLAGDRSSLVNREALAER